MSKIETPQFDREDLGDSGFISARMPDRSSLFKNIGKKLTLLVGLSSPLAAFASCTRVEPGYTAVKVNQWGDQKGGMESLGTGLHFYNPFKYDIYEYPTFRQNAVWTKDATNGSQEDDSITFNSKEGAIINADIALSYTFEEAKVPEIFREFRKDPDALAHGFLKNEIANAFNRHASIMKATDIFGEQKQEYLDAVKNDLNELLGPKGFHFDMVSFHGALRVDKRVQDSINAVLEASQRAIEAQAKVVQVEAEAKQTVAKASGDAQSRTMAAEADGKAKTIAAEAEAKAILLQAEAQATANERITASLTPAVIEWQRIQNWDGKLPQVTGGAIPFIDAAKYSDGGN